MPELQTRDEYEAAIVLALTKAWEPYLSGTIDQERFAADTRAALESPLYEAGLDAAYGFRSEEGGTIGGIPLSKQIHYWAAGRASLLGIATTATSFRLLATMEPEKVFSAARIATIATTEVTGAVTAAEGITLGLLLRPDRQLISIWKTAEDELVCDVCGPLDGTDRVIFGHVSDSGPPAHPNCRCWLEYEMIDVALQNKLGYR
jgi:hypothetical protein